MTDGFLHKFEIAEQNKSVLIITLDRIVLGGSDALIFSQKLNDLPAMNIRHVIVDLGSVGVINSSGLGMLVAALTTARKLGISLVLSTVPEKVMKLLEMTHLNKVFGIYMSVSRAMMSIE